jgi:hypothetical protein
MRVVAPVGRRTVCLADSFSVPMLQGLARPTDQRTKFTREYVLFIKTFYNVFICFLLSINYS